MDSTFEQRTEEQVTASYQHFSNEDLRRIKRFHSEEVRATNPSSQIRRRVALAILGNRPIFTICEGDTTLGVSDEATGDCLWFDDMVSAWKAAESYMEERLQCGSGAGAFMTIRSDGKAVGAVWALAEEGCEGHPAEDAADRFPHAAIGETVFCDGKCVKS